MERNHDLTNVWNLYHTFASPRIGSFKFLETTNLWSIWDFHPVLLIPGKTAVVIMLAAQYWIGCGTSWNGDKVIWVWILLTAEDSLYFYRRQPLANGSRTSLNKLQDITTHSSKCWYVWLAMLSTKCSNLHTWWLLKNGKFVDFVNSSIGKTDLVAEYTLMKEEMTFGLLWYSCC